VKVTSYPMVYQGGYEVYFCSRWWAPDVSPVMFLRLWPMIRWADVVHLTAVYSPPTMPTLLICRLLGKPLMWSPQGALQRWDHTTNRTAKRIWEQMCRLLLDRRICTLHTTSAEEAADSTIRIPHIPVEVVPNGVGIPDLLPNRVWQPEGRLRLLYLGRLHPIKGIENLVQALKFINDETVTLSICGSGNDDYTTKLKALIRELRLENRISFHGHVDGVSKLEALMNADVCLVPSFSENFGMAIAEALAHAVPVIASRGTPWSSMEQRGCGLWVDNSPQKLAEAISSVRTRPLKEMGTQGRVWMKAEFGWEAIAGKLVKVYETLLKRG
jgi:glycosyltransferase involved in cell wall biosynthesis